MKIIRNPDLLVLRILGEPAVFKNQNKRLLETLIMVEVEDGLLVLNGLTRAIVLLDREEIEDFDKLWDINTYEFLHKNYFIVDEKFDEWEAFEKVRKLKRKPIDDLYLNHPTSYTVFTTTKCNARCFYCYELGMKNKKDMSVKTAKKVADYILKATPSNVPANIAWFGGEPLYNAKVINTICDYLRDNGKEFYSSITTNGYLFDKKLVKKAKNSWKLTRAQITIDGTEEVYNTTKRYVYKDKMSPYKKVMKSIEALLEEYIKVHVRINVDLYNLEDTKALIEELHRRFKESKEIFVYVWPIFQEGIDNIKEKRTEEDNIKLYNGLNEIEDLIVSLGFPPTKKPLENLSHNQCMADDGESIMFLPDGDIGLCEHFGDSHFISHIDDFSNKDFDEIRHWNEYINNKELCYDCPILGECNSLKACKELGICDPFKKEWNIKRYVLGLLDIYKNFKKTTITDGNIKRF